MRIVLFLSALFMCSCSYDHETYEEKKARERERVPVEFREAYDYQIEKEEAQHEYYRGLESQR